MIKPCHIIHGPQNSDKRTFITKSYLRLYLAASALRFKNSQQKPKNQEVKQLIISILLAPSTDFLLSINWYNGQRQPKTKIIIKY